VKFSLLSISTGGEVKGVKMLNKKLNLKYVLAAMLIAVFILPQICLADISYDSEYVFNNAATECLSATALDATHSLIAYDLEYGGHDGMAVIATISDTISYGTNYGFNTASTWQSSATALDATHALIAYTDRGNDNHGTAIIATISGSDISFGSEYVFDASTGDTVSPSAVALDATHVLIAYRDYGNYRYGTAIIATISGSDISFGSEYVFSTADNAQYISATALDATHALIAYKAGKAVIATISGTGTGATISYSSEYKFSNGLVYTLFTTALDATHALIAYRDPDNSSYGTAVIATISDTISYGSKSVFNSAVISNISATALDSTHALIAYSDVGNSNKGTGIIATISGSDISYGAENVFNPANTYYNSATALDATHALIAYSDWGNSNKGTGIIATKSPDAPIVTNSTGASDVTASTARLNGEVTSTGGENPTVHVYWGDNDGVTTPLDWDNDVNLGSLSAGTFFTDISSLNPNTTYYYRCYATNSGGEDWADATAQFNTLAAPPIPPGGGTITQNGISITFPPGHDWNGSFDEMSMAYQAPAGITCASPQPISYTIGQGTATGTFPLRMKFEWDPTNAAFGVNPPTYNSFGIMYNDGSGWKYLIDDGNALNFAYDFDGVNPDSVVFDAYHFSDYGADGGATLPVELLSGSLMAEYATNEYSQEYVVVKWATASETDVIGFNIYRSNENDFEAAEKINSEMVSGQGTSSETHNYTYRDETIMNEAQAGDTYWYWLEVIELGGYSYIYDETCNVVIPDSYEPPVPPDIPIIYGLYQNCPNPFNPASASRTKVFFCLHKGAEVEINVYNLLGQHVRCIYNGYAEFDNSNLIPRVAYWDGKDKNGIEQPTGIYLYQLSTNGKVNEIKRLIILR